MTGVVKRKVLVQGGTPPRRMRRAEEDAKVPKGSKNHDFHPKGRGEEVCQVLEK